MDDRTHEVTAFVEHAVWTGVTDSERAKWLEMRNTMLTASDIAAVLGEDPYRSPLDVYVAKVMPQEPDADIGLDDPRFWGHVLEQPILKAVAQYYAWQYRRGGALLRSRRWPHLGCTLDAEIDRGSGWIPLEGKTTRVPRGWSQEEGELPTRVLLQTQQQLAVTGAPHELVFALLQGSRPVQIEVEPSPELHEIMAQAAEELLERVQRLDPPPAGARDRAALAKLYPEDTGEIVELSDEVAEWTRELQELSAQRLEIEGREDTLKNRIRQLLGEATFGVLPVEIGGKSVWKCALEHRSEKIISASSSRVLRSVKGLPKAKKGQRS